MVPSTGEPMLTQACPPRIVMSSTGVGVPRLRTIPEVRVELTTYVLLTFLGNPRNRLTGSQAPRLPAETNWPTPPEAIIHSILSRETPYPRGSKTEAIITTSLPTGATTWVGLSETPD